MVLRRCSLATGGDASVKRVNAQSRRSATGSALFCMESDVCVTPPIRMQVGFLPAT